MIRYSQSFLLAIFILPVTHAEWAPDLLPVTFRKTPVHGPVVLVENGTARGNICVMGSPARGPLRLALEELQECLELATGARLPVMRNRIKAPAIVIGDCAEAANIGLVGKNMPVEGFTIKTAGDLVFIVGKDGPIDGGGKGTASRGTAWGVFEFLERFVDVRWYYPTERGGRSIRKKDSLVIDPVWLEDAPVFRKREIWPPMGHPPNGTGQPLYPLQTRLRHNNSWPVSLVVHSPRWWNVEDYKKNRPEVFQQRSDGTRDFQMICYGNPRTLETYIENIAAHFDAGKEVHLGIAGNAITVSPNDAAIACYCSDCRRLWNDRGGQYGAASGVVADFTRRLALQVKKRWPGKTVIYLPYLNYTLAPAGVRFPGNVQVQLCGMPGIAQYKEPGILESEQKNIDQWVKITGRKIQNWHYSCWPADKIKAPYQYIHVLKNFYQANRGKVIGTFINGTKDHWPRQHLSLYCWMKLLWNPDFDVDAMVDEYCKRMFGPAARTMRELARLQTDGWEKSRWPGGRLSPKGVYTTSFPRKTVTKMFALLKQARQEAAGQPLVLQRLEYYEGPFKPFLEEYRAVMEGAGLRGLIAAKVGENPTIDGILNEPVWKRAPVTPLFRYQKKKEAAARYATQVKAVWTLDGLTFGIRLEEPAPDKLVRNIKSRDDSMAWWNDNVEIFMDVTGKKEGEFYQFIINPNGALADFKTKDATWNVQGEKIGTHLGKDSWSLEVYLPYSAFPDIVRPATGIEWYGQITRHRMGDYKTNKQHPREYSRMNFKFGGGSANLADFGPVKFVE